MPGVRKRTGKDKVRSEPWIVWWKDETGKRRWKRGFTDKAKSLDLARTLDDQARAIQTGLVSLDEDRARKAQAGSMAEHLSDWAKVMTSKGDQVKHIKHFHGTVARLLDSAQVEQITDITADRIQAALAELRAQRSARTANHARTAVLAFLKWAWDDGRLLDLPRGLNKIRKFPEGDAARKYVRGVLTWSQLQQLIGVVAAQGTKIVTRRARDKTPTGTMTGPDRASVYLVAMATGFRADELASLTPGDFRLDDPTGPYVRLRAGHSKRGKRSGQDDIQPLPPGLAQDLTRYLTGRPKDKPIWALPEKTAQMIRADLALAGLEGIDQAGGRIDFHALRHSFVTHLVASGLNPKIVQQLARHSQISLTMDRYTHIAQDDVRKAMTDDLTRAIDGPTDVMPID